ncbi:MAG: ADP-ribosylglycohydrolase family protein, partial [Dehalococcoidia bacterium]|nr:ADP-ribosylglycohydrolase family protein [Dehalococcoidia bacterium]
MRDNTGLLQDCITHSMIRVNDAGMLHRAPAALPADFDFQKVEGMLLGLAIGDALGAPTEGMLPAERHSRYGEVRDYLPPHHPHLGTLGAVTDDTQLAFWTLEQLIADGGLVPEHLADKLCSGHIHGIGSTVTQFIRNHKDQGLPWQVSGVDSLGNGALMRIAPILLPHLQHPTASLFADAALDAMVTHNNYANIAACVAFVAMLWQLLGMRQTPEPDWWLDSFVSAAMELEGETSYTPRLPAVQSYHGPVWRFADLMCRGAMETHAPVVDACNHWGSGASLLETVPSALYILAKYGHDPEAALIRAVNDT